MLKKSFNTSRLTPHEFVKYLGTHTTLTRRINRRSLLQADISNLTESPPKDPKPPTPPSNGKKRRRGGYEDSPSGSNFAGLPAGAGWA